jgi:hypothetical protein
MQESRITGIWQLITPKSEFSGCIHGREMTTGTVLHGFCTLMFHFSLQIGLVDSNIQLFVLACRQNFSGVIL